MTRGARIAVVAGGARGVGRAAALALAADGADIALWDCPDRPYRTLDYPLATAADLDETAAAIRVKGRRALIAHVDVSDRAAVAAAADQVERELGDPTDLVIASGVVSVVPVSSMSRAHWDEAVTTNLTGAFHVLQRIVPGMAARRTGGVAIIAGQEGRRGSARLSHVSAAAWGLIGLAKTVALEVAEAGVNVTVICPGPVRSVPLEHSAALQAVLSGTSGGPGPYAWQQIAASHPQQRACVEPAEVAEAVRFLLSAAARSFTGGVMDLSLGTAARNSG